MATVDPLFVLTELHDTYSRFSSSEKHRHRTLFFFLGTIRREDADLIIENGLLGLKKYEWVLHCFDRRNVDRNVGSYHVLHMMASNRDGVRVAVDAIVRLFNMSPPGFKSRKSVRGQLDYWWNMLGFLQEKESPRKFSEELRRRASDFESPHARAFIMEKALE